MKTQSIHSSTRVLLSAIVAAGVAGSASAALLVEQPDTNAAFGNAATGQSFTPNVGITATAPDTLPAASTTTIDLTSFTLYSGGAGNDLSDTTYLLIYDANPSGTANLVGSSTNSIDTSPAPTAGTAMTWNFASLTLNYDDEYFAVMSSSNTGTSAGDIGLSIQVLNDPANPYTGGSGLIANFGESAGGDAKFTATFANPVPEPTSLALIGLGGLLIASRRRRDA